MNFGESISTCMGKYFTFSGRASRSEYWWFYLFATIVPWGGQIVSSTMYTTGDPMVNLLPTIISLAFLFPILAAGSRRLHDIGKSGWWMLISAVPLIGGIWLLILLVTDSQLEENIYGENSHHKIESCYKGLARSLKDALEVDKRIKNSIPSTKGSI